jgi:hypothetical protein
MSAKFGIVRVLQSLRPKAQWIVSGDEYSGIEWLDEVQTKPTEQECIAEENRLQLAYEALRYQRLRAPEYPPITDYIDGVVKGDQEQIDAYVTACLAVKEKYPKPIP